MQTQAVCAQDGLLNAHTLSMNHRLYSQHRQSTYLRQKVYLGNDNMAELFCGCAGALLASLGYPDHQHGPPLCIPALPPYLQFIQYAPSGQRAVSIWAPCGGV